MKFKIILAAITVISVQACSREEANSQVSVADAVTTSRVKIDTSVFEVQGVLQPPPPFETVMARNDLDKNGIITKAEAIQAGTLLGSGFDSWDPNKDGQIVADELNVIIDAINTAIAEQQGESN